MLPDRRKPNLPVKRVFPPGAELALTGEVLLWAEAQDVAEDEPLFFSRKVVPTVAAGHFSVARPGSSSMRLRSGPTFESRRCVPRSMVRPAGWRRCIPIYSAMRGCGRFCARTVASRLPSGRPGGRAFSGLSEHW